jgi:hypothetical protein
MCISLSTKILHITGVSCRLLFDNPATQDYKGVGSRRPGGRSESMLHSFFLVLLLQLLPLQLLQDHFDSNLEASGMTMACSLHQAVPGNLQVTVPIGDV